MSLIKQQQQRGNFIAKRSRCQALSFQRMSGVLQIRCRIIWILSSEAATRSKDPCFIRGMGSFLGATQPIPSRATKEKETRCQIFWWNWISMRQSAVASLTHSDVNINHAAFKSTTPALEMRKLNHFTQRLLDR